MATAQQTLAGCQRHAGTLWRRLWYGVQRLHARPDWPAFAGGDWAEHIMSVAVTDRFHAKQGRSTGRWILQTGDRRLAVYLKRHYRLPWWQGLLAALWPEGGWSPAWQEWRNLHWAREQGLPVPAPVAAGEFIGPWGRLQSVLAVEELTGMSPLHLVIPKAAKALAPTEFARWKRGLTAELARLTRALHGRRRFHKDLYLCHFYLPEDAVTVWPGLERAETWRGRVHMIDLHRLGQHRRTWLWWQVKDLAQLLYSSDVVGVDDRDRLRFWRAYLGASRRAWLGRLLGLGIRLRAWNYHRHKARRRDTRSSPASGGGKSSEANAR
jgi:heptose I phosphotransferase